MSCCCDPAYHCDACGCCKNSTDTTTFNTCCHHKSDEISSFKPGDLLRFYSNGSCAIHYAVYLGRSQVAHLTLCDLCRCKSKKKDGSLKCEKCNNPKWGQVEQDNLRTMMRLLNKSGKHVYLKVKKDDIHSKKQIKFSETEIKERAESVEGATMFGWWKGNCEHFATWCVYDEPVSFQSKCRWKSSDNYLTYLKGNSNWPPEGEKDESDVCSVQDVTLTESELPVVEEQKQPKRRERER